MPRKKGKHATPAHLDQFFERDIITQRDYDTFWPAWWKADKRGQSKIVDKLLLKIKETRLGLRKVVCVVTKNKADAKRQAGIIKGRVVRRDAKGRFSKRGHFYQSIYIPAKKKRGKK